MPIIRKQAMPKRFPYNTALADMTAEQWDSLCDGCGLCCLHKLEDEDDGEIFYTDVACQLLDTSRGKHSCRCTDYPNRTRRVADCLVLTPATLADSLPWLPATCAYKRLALGQRLPRWHPLLTGNPASVHQAGISARGRCVPESRVDPDTLAERIVTWVDGFRAPD